MRARILVAWALALLGLPASAQEPSPPLGREAALALEFPPLRFDPLPVRVDSVGPEVPVLYLHDPDLPLVTVVARFRGGYGLFPRDRYAAATAMPGLLRNGGTETLPPDSVDVLMESLALQMAFGTGGETVFSSVNALESTLDEAMALWSDMLRHPAFDTAQIEIWRGRELESVRRRRDDPRRLAFSEFNRIMYGDHPTGWEMTVEDLHPTRLTPDLLRTIHQEILCPQNMVLGITGDITWDEARSRLETLVAGWPPCPGPLPEPPRPQIRREPGVFLIPRDLSQTTVVMAHTTGVHQGDGADYYASRIGNTILGSSGLSSRLMSRIRTEEGLAYGASSLWTAPRISDGLLGAITQTRSENTVAAVRTVLEVLEQMTLAAPDEEEVSLAVDQAVNGFVFNFQTASQVISRRMLYLSQGMPEDWLERYVERIQQVEPEDVRKVFERHLRVDQMTILIVGDPERFEEGIEEFGDVTVWEVDGGAR